MSAAKVTKAIDEITPKTGAKVTHTGISTYGTRYNISDFALDDLITLYAVQSLLAGLNPPYDIAFASVTGLTINWQTDNVPGLTSTTYATYFGNQLFRKPTVYQTVNNEDGTSNNTSIDFNITVKTDNTTGFIDTVVFDWAVAQSGFVVF